MVVLLIYLLLMNAAGFILMLADKHKARKHQWRIPEKTLFAVALLGGSIGSIAGMYSCRHKTKHPSFTIGMPVILCLQIAAAIIIAAGIR